MKLARVLAFAVAASFASAPYVAQAAPDVAKLQTSRVEAAAKAFAVSPTGKAATQAFTDHAARMLELAKTVSFQFQQGLMAAADVDATAYFRIEADVWSGLGKLQ